MTEPRNSSAVELKEPENQPQQPLIVTAKRAGGRGFLQVIWKNTDSLTKWFQVIALMIGATWAGMEFYETQLASLVIHPDIGASLSGTGTWYPKDLNPSENPMDYCHVSATFTIGNSGVKSFEVDHIRVRAWRLPLSTATEAVGKPYIDISRIENDTTLKRVAELSRFDSALVGHYYPKQIIHEGYSWIFYGPASTDLFLTTMDVYRKPEGRLKSLLDKTLGIKTDDLLGTTSAWSTGICARQN